MAVVGQPRGPHTRWTYTFTLIPAPETPAIPTVRPTIVPVVCVPWPSPSLGLLSLLTQSRPAMSCPERNSVWLKSTPVSMLPTTTPAPPAP